MKYPEYLKAHGLNAKQAEALGFCFYPSKEELNAALPGLPRLQLRPAFTIPYYDWQGKPTDFKRARFLGPLLGFAAATTARALRYCQPYGTKPQLYIPLNPLWPKIRDDQTQPLIITEGEIKAVIAMRETKIATLALGGVNSFVDDNGFLPALEEIAWRERTVYICFDSDRATNLNIPRAERKLAAELLKRKADVFICEIPELVPDEKMGLDDYLLKSGAETFQTEILDEARPCVGAQGLYDMNQEFAFIKKPVFIVRVPGLQDINVQNFKHLTKPRWYEVETQSKSGVSRKKKIFISDEWLESKERNDVERKTYAPGQPRYTENNELNTWPGWGCEPKPGDVRPFFDLFNYLTAAITDEERKYLLQGLAYPIQHPGTKLQWALLIWSIKHGTGKSLLGEMLGKIYGRTSQTSTTRSSTATSINGL